MTAQAQKALKAAKMRRSCGRYAAMVWAAKNGVNMRLYRIACQLMAVEKV